MSKKQVQNIIDNRNIGVDDIQRNASLLHDAGTPNDETIGILGVGRNGESMGVVFVDQRLSVLYSEATDRTIVTLKEQSTFPHKEH